MPFNLVIGYTDYGNCLMRHHGAGKAKSMTKLAKPWYDWAGKICAVIFINGVVQPIDRKDVILRSLSRAYEMLTETDEICLEYGYGKHMWETWISRLDNDNNYKAKSNVLKYIVPEKFDLAERRAFAAHFFKEAESYIGDSLLKDAFDAFNDIHNKMWDIHWMVKGENEGRLLERETRDKIVEILRHCQTLDLKAAENIKQVLDRHNQLTPTKFDNHVNVIGADGQTQNPTYIRRAKGLVKNGRAQWVDEKTIKMIDPSDEAGEPEEIIIEKQKYHCQHQAESFARSIIPVPKDYPLQSGLPEDFPMHFSKLCELAKDIYMDMAKQPEAYGLMLVDIESGDHNLARDGYRTIHRFVDTLSNLSNCSELNSHQLIVNAEAFRKSLKGGRELASGPVPRYELIFSRFVNFGFVISGFEGKPFGKKVEFFTVEYPDYPEMIDTIKVYCDCWESLKSNRENVGLYHDFHHHYYRLDYKITANREKISITQWLNDNADYLNYSPQQKAFSIAFYEHSLQYKDVEFNGEYTYKSKRIARMCQVGYSALGGTRFHQLHVRLKNMDKYMAEINTMPESIKKLMTKDSCHHCNFQGATADHCKFRVHWEFDGQPHDGCAHACFYFDDLDVALMQDYWRLLELEYGLKK